MEVIRKDYMNKSIDRGILSTEQQNVRSMDLDTRSVSEVLQVINEEDKIVAEAVGRLLPEIRLVVRMTVESIKNSGRIFYIGAGTSGRLGVLDAAECPPTFSAPPEMFNGIIAGGEDALRRSIEGAEDIPENAVADLNNAGIKKGDIIIGIASSSTTQYVIRALEYGMEIGCKTVFLICNPSPLIPIEVDVLIAIDVGQEVITGSTRMKSGTATKMVLNMISTATMVQLGKVYGNLMVDLKAVNEKLVDRGIRIIMKLTSIDRESAKKLLFQANKEVKTAVVMCLRNCDFNRAKEILAEHNGFLRPVIENLEEHSCAN